MIRTGTVLLMLLLIAPLYVRAEPTQHKVGVLLPLTGNYEAVGKENREGVEIALSEIGLDSLEPIFGDSRADPVQSINEFRRIANQEGALALFVFRGPVGMAVNPLSKAARVPILGGVGNRAFAQENPYAFQVWPSSDFEGAFIASSVAARGFQRVAVVTTEDDWTAAVSEGFLAGVRRDSKLEIVFNESVIPGDSDLRAIVTTLRTKKPDLVFSNVSVSQQAPLIRQLRDQKVGAAIVANFWVNNPETINSIGKSAVEGVMYAEMSTDMPQLQAAVKRRFHSDVVSGATLSAYVGMHLIAQAVRELPPIAEEEMLYRSLLRQREVRTPNGNFKIEDRRVQFPLVMRVMSSSRGERAAESERLSVSAGKAEKE